MSTERSLIGRVASSYVVVVVAALLVGALLAPMAYGATNTPDGTVAVVHVEGSTSGPNVDAATDALEEARQNESIEAVVLVMDSGGGPVAPSEDLALAVEQTAAEMPLVAAVKGTAASGGYWGVVGADHVYTQPSAVVGSVGVYATAGETAPGDGIVATGPNKLDGGTTNDVRERVGLLQQVFVDSVVEHRGEELELSEAELAQAKVYTGVGAVENGLADELGTTEAAIADAADRAGLEDYDVVEFESPQQQIPALLLHQDGDLYINQHAAPGLEAGVDRTVYLAVHGAPSQPVVGVASPDAVGVEPADAADIDAASDGGDER